MKRIAFILSGITMALWSYGQTDTLLQKKSDTIKIGEIIIVKTDKDDDKETTIIRQEKKQQKNPNVKTNWWIVDIGFSRFNDNSSYSNLIDAGVLPAGANEDWFNLKSGKSVNVNLWLFMQRLNLIEHVVNLKYGLGLELNNYRYTENIKYPGGKNPLVEMEAKSYAKNKLATDYITVPMMLNLNFTPNNKHGFSLSGGVSIGYLYSDRQKLKESEGKRKFRDNYDLDPWKISYIAEAGIGPVTLYGSLATKSMYKNTLDHTPYNIGLRFSSW